MLGIVRSWEPVEYRLQSAGVDRRAIGDPRMLAGRRLNAFADPPVQVDKTGAEQGSGPVIRVGDAGLTFSADAEAVLIRARETLQGEPGGFRSQRQRMVKRFSRNLALCSPSRATTSRRRSMNFI